MESRGTYVGTCALATVWRSCPIISCCVRRYVDDVISRIGRMFPDMTIELFRPNGNSAVLLVSTHVCSKCQRNPSVCSGPFSVATQGQRCCHSQRPIRLIEPSARRRRDSGLSFDSFISMGFQCFYMLLFLRRVFCVVLVEEMCFENVLYG